MQFKKGLGWKACYDEDRNIYTAERSWKGFYQLCEITKEIYDLLGTDTMGSESEDDLIMKGRELFRADDDPNSFPYYVVSDDDFAELAPWSNAKSRAEKTDSLIQKLEEEKAEKNKNEKKLEELAPYFKAVLDADKAPIVMCGLDNNIIYMNPSAIKKYSRWGGEGLVGRSILDCHNEESRKKIEKVIRWFVLSNEHNIVYTFRNEKENKDVYMVALRNTDGALIGYYEKHEYRDPETMPLYDLWY